MATKKKDPIDPLTGSRHVLDGRVVTMNGTFRVIDKGRIYVSEGVIRAVREASAAAPAEFADAPVITTRGTIFPGLIELHNHLSYNALQLWQVPRIFAHRGQWSNHPDKRRLISQPMSVLAGIGGTIEALVRYVETKCLVSGVTTSQGLTLVAAPGIEHRYRGIVRNVEATDDPTLPEALTRIADVESVTAFEKRLKQADEASLLLHLAEGIGESARKHFLKLKLPSGKFAISPALLGIHAAGLIAEDLDVLAENGGSIVWSPLSNLLLYGGTAEVKSAKAAGVRMSLGSDWSPSGSKNLLSELKVARAYSDLKGGLFAARDLVAMATINPARMLKWDAAVGSVEPDKRADLLVISGKTGDPYEKLLKALEDDVTLVVINGVPRFGTATLMDKAIAAVFPESPPALESRSMAGHATKFNFVQATADPLVAPVTLASAEKILSDALRDLPELASGLADPFVAASLLGIMGATDAGPTRRWTLELDNDEPHALGTLEGTTLRPLAPPELRPRDTPFGGDALALNGSLAANLVSMKLDALTIVEDGDYFARLVSQINLPAGFAADIVRLHGQTAPVQPSGRVINLPVSDSPDQIGATLPRSLAELRAMSDGMTRADRIKLVRQLRGVLDKLYVHLPLKRAAHAVDPLQRLRILQYRLEELGDAPGLEGLLFHQEIVSIFTELRDLHTVYILPPPYSDLTAFLPFLLERGFDPPANGSDPPRPVYLVTKVVEGSLAHPTFKPGVEILYWNGMPVANAVEQNADRQGGSNLAARFARGLVGMTVRPLARALPPDDEWVLLTYRSLDGRVLEIRLPWQIRSRSGTSSFTMPVLSAQATSAARNKSGRKPIRRRPRPVDIGALSAFGLDIQMETINLARRDLFATKPVRRRLRVSLRRGAATEELRTRFSDVLRARVIPVKGRPVGYLRIFTFSVPDADAFVAEVVRLLGQMPPRGVILDVRNNGGGLIWAAEQLLQLFTDRRIEPERAQFLNSNRALDLVRRHAPSTLSRTLDLKPWIESMSVGVITAAVHSEGFPITPPDRANAVGRKYRGPVVLITDALAYSATDIFAAGFRDHDIGPILGVDDNTGAGGANVWSYALLERLFADKEPSLEPLPGGCDVRVAMRRTLRAGANAGMPLEDLGVVPNERHYLTRRDILSQNEDLIEHAAQMLVHA
jgi:Peptidase family S41/Amidohydrolase family